MTTDASRRCKPFLFASIQIPCRIVELDRARGLVRMKEFHSDRHEIQNQPRGHDISSTHAMSFHEYRANNAPAYSGTRISDASTFRVPVNVRRPCMQTKLSTKATSPRCQGMSKLSSSPNRVAMLTASRSSGEPSPNVIDLEGSLRSSFQPWKAAINWLKNDIRPSGNLRTAGRMGVVTRRELSGCHVQS